MTARLARQPIDEQSSRAKSKSSNKSAVRLAGELGPYETRPFPLVILQNKAYLIPALGAVRWGQR